MSFQVAQGFYVVDDDEDRVIDTGLSGELVAAHVWQRGDQVAQQSRAAWSR